MLTPTVIPPTSALSPPAKPENRCHPDYKATLKGAKTLISSSTLVTPGAFHAARSASRRSTTERTVPRRVTRDRLVSTVIRSAPD